MITAFIDVRCRSVGARKSRPHRHPNYRIASVPIGRSAPLTNDVVEQKQPMAGEQAGHAATVAGGRQIATAGASDPPAAAKAPRQSARRNRHRVPDDARNAYAAAPWLERNGRGPQAYYGGAPFGWNRW